MCSKPWFTQQLQFHIDLLKRQIGVESLDSELSKSRKEPIFLHFPRKNVIEVCLFFFKIII